MSDHDPRPPGVKRDLPRDPLRAPEVDPVTRGSGIGGFYLVGGVTLALVLVAGLMFFNPGSAPGERNDQARQPDRTIETPARPPTNPQR